MSSRRHGRRHGLGPVAGAANTGTATTAPPVQEPQVAEFHAEEAGVAPPRSTNGHGPTEANGRIVSAPEPNGASRGDNRGGQSRRSGKSQRPRGQMPTPARQAASETESALEDAESCKPKGSCTLAQMRRFIKSRPYVPVHELRRRFEIEGVEDEVSAMVTDRGTYYVGLPEREAGFLTELLKSGDVGCELLLDPSSPAVVGVYAMRPVARQ